MNYKCTSVCATAVQRSLRGQVPFYVLSVRGFPGIFRASLDPRGAINQRPHIINLHLTCASSTWVFSAQYWDVEDLAVALLSNSDCIRIGFLIYGLIQRHTHTHTHIMVLIRRGKCMYDVLINQCYFGDAMNKLSTKDSRVLVIFLFFDNNYEL